MNRALRPVPEIPPGYVSLESDEPWRRGTPDIGPSARQPSRFVLETWPEITFDSGEEWLVKRFLPRHGVAVTYGKPASFKSFVASHLALCCALGWAWADRRVLKASVVYIAAEGASGHRKRKAGYVKAYPDLPACVDFALISAAPNLGVEPGDLAELTEAIERANVSPGLIVLDTLAQTLGGSDENGAGMTAFLANAGEARRTVRMPRPDRPPCRARRRQENAGPLKPRRRC